MKEYKNILLVDFPSEKNRGDAAMQVGLIKLVYQYFPDPMVTIISVFGVNQANQLKSEYDHTSKYPVSIMGGLKPTFYPIDGSENESLFTVELKQALSFSLNIVLLLLLVIKTPLSLIRWVLPKAYFNTLEHMRDADLVIWKGRNFRSRENFFLELFRTLHVVYHPLVCSLLAKPIACVGASVWHLNNPVSRWILKYVFNKCFFLSLREEASYDEARKLLGDKTKTYITLLPDLSFAVYDQAKAIKENREPLSDSLYPKTVGLTIVDWKNNGEQVRNNYKKAVSGLINYYLGQGSKIVIIPQVTKTWEANDSMVSEIVMDQRNNGDISIIKGNLTIDELMSIYSKLDFLVATRMHSAIFASFVGTPLIVIPYDKGGKWSIIQGLGYRDYIINYIDVSTATLIERTQHCWNNKKSLLKTVDQKIHQYIDLVDLHVKKLLEVSPK